MTTTTTEDQVELEAMIDRHGLYTVLSMLSDVCSDKAQHLRSNWQDDRTATQWEKAMSIVDRAAGRADALDLT